MKKIIYGLTTIIIATVIIFACQKEKNDKKSTEITNVNGKVLKTVDDHSPIGVIVGNQVNLVQSEENLVSIFLQNYPSLKESWTQGKVIISDVGFSIDPAGINAGTIYLKATGIEVINDSNTPFIAAIPLIIDGDKLLLYKRLKGMTAEVITLHKCTGDPCSQCDFNRKDGEIIGCVCTVGGCVTPPCKCNHTREQVIVPE